MKKSNLYSNIFNLILFIFILFLFLLIYYKLHDKKNISQ